MLDKSFEFFKANIFLTFSHATAQSYYTSDGKNWHEKKHIFNVSIKNLNIERTSFF